MSGIVALFHRQGGTAAAASVEAMLATVPYRGPDGLHVRCIGSVGLGHARMVVTPEDEHEVQPLVSRCTGCVVVADARLDNRDDLLSRLPVRPRPDVGDGELILRCYEAWGLDALPELLGDFAFLVWDPRRQRLVGARDTSGQRTLFYRIDAATFAAASEIRQLLQDPDVPVRPNEETIRRSFVPLYLSSNERDRADTYFDGIHALEPGHALIVEPRAMQIRRYWELRPPPELRYRDPRQYAEHYRSLFGEVVRARLRSARPIGALLSGGLDSASIVCVAHELYRIGAAHDPGFTGFSLVFDGLECDERDLIADVQAKYGFASVLVESADLAGPVDLDQTGFQESPNIGSREQRDAVCAAAADRGVRMLLTGDIADSCVVGFPLVFDSLLRQRQWRAFGRYLRAYRESTREPLGRILALYCLAPLLPLQLQRLVYSSYIRRKVRMARGRLLPSWMPEALRAELAETHAQLLSEEEGRRRFRNPTREWEYQLLYPPELARHPAPWPIELWRPFADRRLHALLLSIPPEQKFDIWSDAPQWYGRGKLLVRRAMEGIVPDRIRTRRSKTVFNAVYTRTVDRHWPAFERVFGPPYRSEVSQRGLVDPAAFWARLQTYRDGAEGEDAAHITQVICLERWLRSLSHLELGRGAATLRLGESIVRPLQPEPELSGPGVS